MQAGDGITYLATLSNTGNTNATSVVLSNPLDPNSNFVPGSTKIGVAAFADSYNVIGNTPRTLDAVGGLLGNDIDIDAGGAFTVTGVTDIGGTATNGVLAVNADGSFTYTPATGTNGTDIFRYNVLDSDGLVSTGQVTFSISSMVWFVDNSAPGGGDGSFNNPFNSLAPVNGAGGAGDVDAPGDTIFVYETGVNYAGGFQLENNQQLIGDGYAFTLFDLVVGNNNIAPVLTSASGSNVTLASNNNVRGLNLTSTGGTALSGTNFGSASITNMLVNATNATAINLNTGTGTFSFSSVNANGGTNGIVLNGVNATSFAITGDGSTATQGGNDSGGIIQSMTGDGVVITNSNNITLQNMTIGNPATTTAASPNGNINIGDDGIQATTVTNLTLKNITIAETGTHGINANTVVNFVMDDSMILNAGDGNEENGILFRELTGDNFIRRSLFDAYNESGIDLLNTTGQSDLTIFDTTFQDNKATVGNFGEEGILLVADGSAQIVALVTGTAGATTKSIFDDNQAEGIQAISLGTTSDIQLTVENSRFLESNSGDGLVIFQVDNTGSGNLTVKDNFFTDDTNGPFAVIANNASTGLMDVTITNNTTANVQLLSSIHDDIGIAGAGGQTRLSLTNNSVTMNNNFVPVQIIVEEAVATGSAPDYSAIIQGNTNTQPDGNFTFTPGLLITVRNQARFDGEINGNSFQGDPTFAGGPGIQLEEFGANAVVNLQGYVGGNNISAQNYLNAVNPSSTGPSFVNLAAGSDGFVGNGAPTAPNATTRPNPLVVTQPTPDPGDIGPVGPAGDGLTQSELDAAVAEAINRWAAIGLTTEQIALLQGVDIQAASLGNGLLGITLGNQIRIDDNGADFGWFIDSTLGDDVEFTNGSAVSQVDLLTVVMHEFGHVLGVSHTADGLMGSSLALASRYNPTADLMESAGASSGLIESLSVAVPAPGGGTGTGAINLGTLPAFSSVQVRFQATVGTGAGLPGSLSAQGTITAVDLAPVLTDDPNVGGAADPTETSVQSLTLSGTVWQEANANTTYQQGTDTGVNGVTVNLYLDGGSGVLDLEDGSPIATTTTSNMAGEDGRYEFTNIAPGNYLVEVITSSGPLSSLASIPGTVDPDNNVDNDDNGAPVGGLFGTASSAITLDYGTEPGGDINSTLDFGFEAVNQPPTLTLTPAIMSLAENAATTPRIKAADIVINDDGLGMNALSLTGADAALFEIDGMELFLKAGTVLDFETNPSLDVTVQVDDSGVGSTPDDQEMLSISITDVNEAPALSVTNVTSTIPVNVNNTNRVYVETFSVTDVDAGPHNNVVSLAGPDSGLFEIIGNQVFLIANAGLGTLMDTNLDVSLVVDDPGLGAGPEAQIDISMTLTDPTATPLPALPSSLLGFVNENLWLAQRDGMGTYTTTLAQETAFPDANILESFQGDFNGDGREDVAFYLTNGEVYAGIATIDGHFNFSLWTTLRTTGVNAIHVGDFNADGMADLIGIFQSGVQARLWVYESTGTQFLPDEYGKYSDFSGIGSTYVGNFDGVNGDDLAILNQGGVWWVAKSDIPGTSFSYGAAWEKWDITRTITNITVGDFNGDQSDDILGVFNVLTDMNQRSFVVALSQGNEFDSQVWRRATLPGALNALVVGDFDADMHDDFAILTDQQQWTVGLADVAHSRFGFAPWGTSMFTSPVLNIGVGDSNGDGIADILVRDSLSRWHSAESNGTTFVTRQIQQWSSTANWQHIKIGSFASAPPMMMSETAAGSVADDVFGDADFLDLLHAL
ncbi:MAG: cadherin-like domain-containing protein [Planctomycetaceae bacterium]|nr:cadherin-like domain-containing protein [Planctomycetaceae bacterium]